MRWTRRVAAVLLMGGLGLSGCRSEPPPSTVGPGDWEDTGRYAACRYTPVADSSVACGAPEHFDLTSCAPGSLGSVARDGIFTLVYRTDSEPLSISPGVFRISADGSLDVYREVKPTRREVGPERFYLSTTRQVSSSVSMRHALMGCLAEGERLYGCYAICRNGQLSVAGTFQAVKWERRAGEAEASGLRLASESFVALGGPTDVYVTREHAYVVSTRLLDEPGGLTVFDVRDKAAPVLKTSISLPADNYWNGVWAKDDALYVASGSAGVWVFDISTPAKPQLLRRVPAAGGINVHTVFVEGERLYAMSPGPEPKTLIFDIREPRAPVLLGHYAEPGAADDKRVGYPHDALAFEGRLYINHWSGGYLIVDVSDPANARKLGGYTYPHTRSHASAVARYGERLIAFEGGENWGAHVRVLDVTDPGSPKLLGEYGLEPNVSVHNLVWREGRLYVAYYQNGVRVLDVREPEKPREVAYYNTFRETDANRGLDFYEGAIGIRVPGDGYVYAIDTSRGLLIFPEP